MGHTTIGRPGETRHSCDRGSHPSANREREPLSRRRPKRSSRDLIGGLGPPAHQQRLKRNQLLQQSGRVSAIPGAVQRYDSQTGAMVAGYKTVINRDRANTDQDSYRRPREWDRCSRPISDLEGASLRRLGTELRRIRVEAGLSRTDLAYGALLSPAYIGKLELGYRRTRRSTLTRLVAVLLDANPDLGPVEDLVDRLCVLAGPALADETAFPRQVERTLRRKRRKQELFEARAERLHALMSDQQSGGT